MDVGDQTDRIKNLCSPIGFLICSVRSPTSIPQYVPKHLGAKTNAGLCQGCQDIIHEQASTVHDLNNCLVSTGQLEHDLGDIKGRPMGFKSYCRYIFKDILSFCPFLPPLLHPPLLLLSLSFLISPKHPKSLNPKNFQRYSSTGIQN